LFVVGAFEGPLRTAIHNFKYNSDRPLAAPLAALLAEQLHDLRSGGITPLLTPVPLHPAKQRARGYNQSSLLARELAKLLQWDVAEGLERVRPTRSQVGLSLDERRENVSGAFVWRSPEPPPPCVVLVDDVCTTGATLTDCTRALRVKGTHTVYAAAVAKALYDSPGTPF
jgi:ComF family protein